jgi:hypothetical protein
MEVIFSHLDVKEIVTLITATSLGTVLLGKVADWATAKLGIVPPSVATVAGAAYGVLKDGKVTKEELKSLIDGL